MGAQDAYKPVYTEDFTVACGINYLKPDDVLQSFINRVSFYAFNGGEVEAIALWATNIVVDCKVALNAEVAAVRDRKIQRIVIKYVSLLSELNDDRHFSLVEKLKESRSLMEEWENEMQPLTDFPLSLQPSEGTELQLTFDFNLLCRMNGLNPVQVLQYLISHISLAEEHALMGTPQGGQNSCMGFFTALLRLHPAKSARSEVHLKVNQEYAAKLLRMDEELQAEPQADKRIAAFRSFFLQWYQALRVYIN